METNRRPVSRITREIYKIIKEKNYSIRSISDKAQKLGYDYMNRGVVNRNFYEGVDKQLFITKLDDYIEAILAVVGLTSDDLFERLLTNTEINPSIPKEISNFVNNEEALPYIKIAYIQYKKDKLEKELQALKTEVNK